MYKGGSRILPIVLVIVVAIVAIIALVSVGKALLGRSTADTTADTEKESVLLVTEANRSVRMTVRGPIVADEDFNSYQIEIGPSERRMTTYKGYADQIIDTKQYSGSMAAYTEFVHALDRAEFSESVTLSEALGDVRGACATGRLYTFEVLEDGSAVSESWTSSCRNLAGSFRGQASLIRDLFQRQIPDSSTLLRGVNL